MWSRIKFEVARVYLWAGLVATGYALEKCATLFTTSNREKEN